MFQFAQYKKNIRPYQSLGANCAILCLSSKKCLMQLSLKKAYFLHINFLKTFPHFSLPQIRFFAVVACKPGWIGVPPLYGKCYLFKNYV